MNALLSLIRCAEDCKMRSDYKAPSKSTNIYTITPKVGNRVELRKLNIVRRVLDLLNPENQDLHQLSLLLLATCLEDGNFSLLPNFSLNSSSHPPTPSSSLSLFQLKCPPTSLLLMESQSSQSLYQKATTNANNMRLGRFIEQQNWV